MRVNFAIENSHKTLRMPQLAIGVDNFFMRLETLSAAGAEHVVQGHIRDPAKSQSQKCTTCIIVPRGPKKRSLKTQINEAAKLYPGFLAA